MASKRPKTTILKIFDVVAPAVNFFSKFC